MTSTAVTKAPIIPALEMSRFVDIDIYGQAIKADPSPWFLQWADKPPFYVMIHGRPNAVICRHEQVKAAMANYETFSVEAEPGWGTDYLDYFNGLPILAETNPPAHDRMRRLVQPAFAPRRIAQFQAGIDQRVNELIDEIAAKGSFDMITEFAQPLVYRLLLGTFFGFPEQDWQIFSNFSHALELVATEPLGAPKPKAYLDAFSAGMKYCEELIEQRRQQSKDDIVSAVIEAHDKDAVISTQELFTLLMQLFAAGLGTMAGVQGLCMLRLCRHRDQLELLQQDPSLLHSAIEECLRIDTLGGFRHRYVVKDCIVDGVPLYRGMIVHLSMGASNYDPDFYPHPNAFDIKRNPKDISTFGHATHFCVGNALARAVARTSIGRLVKHFPTIRLADPDAQVIYGGMPTERMPLNIQLRVD